jgi:hypothetical protein
MKANELRPGNFVMLYNNETRVVPNDFVKRYEDGKLEGFKPIPLTSDWYEKLGFSPEGSEAGDDGALQLGGWDEHKKKFSFLWIGKTGRYTEKHSLGLWITSRYGQDNIKLPLKRVKYVHQLQNLYFAITGKELEMA